MDNFKEFYIIKKNVNGEYLLSPKNEIIEKCKDEHLCWNKFHNLIANKTSKSDIYVVCTKYINDKYIHILCER